MKTLENPLIPVCDTSAWTRERDLARSWVSNANGEAGYSPMTLRKNARALPPVILMMSASV